MRIPVEIQNNIILVPLRVNGSFEMNFILDTGVKTTILVEPVITPFLALDSVRKVLVRGLGDGNAIEAAMARNVAISLPGVEGRGINLLVLPEGIISYSGMFGKPVYGIIGYEIFNQFIVELNYQQKYIQLYNPFEFKLLGRWSRLPIGLNRSKPYVTAEMTDFRGEQIRSEWLIDTGASMAISLFDERLPVPEKTIEAFLGQGLSGNVYGKMARVKTFKLGEFVFEDVITGYPEPGSLNLPESDSAVWYGNIGAEVISRFRIIFDYGNEQVFLRKNSEFKSEFEYNVSGIEVVASGLGYDVYLVTYVRPGSPAENAGLKVNDELIAVNGSPVVGLTIEDIYTQLSKRIGRNALMKVRRNGAVIKFTFPLTEDL